MLEKKITMNLTNEYEAQRTWNDVFDGKNVALFPRFLYLFIYLFYIEAYLESRRARSPSRRRRRGREAARLADL